MKRILKFIGCLALAFAGAGAYGAIWQVATQEALDLVLKDENVSMVDVVEITAAGTYKLSSIPKNITIRAASGVAVKIDATGSGSICGTKAGATFEGLEFTFGNTGYHGFQSGAALIFNDCTLNGLLFSYNAMTFNHCTFNQTASEYMMWCYAGNVTYKDCIFNGNGKFFNIYNEGNAKNGPWVITYDGCVFNSTKLNKAAINVKATCGTVPMVYDVRVNNCTANGDNFPAASVSDTLIVFNGLIQLDDISASTPNEITITQDGKVLYAENAVVSAPAVQVEVEENNAKGITAVVVQEIVTNPEIEKVEQKAIAEAIKADVEGKDEAFVKVTLQEVKTEANKTTLQFVVAPYIGAVQVNNDNIKGAVPFRLPLLKEKFVEYAKITHAGDPDRFVLVKKGANGEPYVDVALTHFSTVLASVATEADMVPEGAVKIRDGLWGDKNTLGEAKIVYIVGKTGLKAFRDWVNEGNSGVGQTFQLVADVDLGNEEWTPIANGSNVFKGTFDGTGHDIAGLKISSGKKIGLFGTLDAGLIKDLTLTGVDVGGSEDVGGVVACINNGGVVNGVTVKSGSVSNASKRTGGIAAMINAIGKILNCTNNATVKGTHASNSYNLGGIVGAAYYSNAGQTLEDCVIANCVNNGDVSTEWQSAAGIVGFSIASVRDCVNNGKITVKRGNSAGGIVGNIPHNFGEIVRCINNGEVDGSAISRVGGIVGYFQHNYVTDPNGAYKATETTLKICGNVNNGKVTANADVAGIIGFAGLGGGGDTTINFELVDNENNGEVFCGASEGFGLLGGAVIGGNPNPNPVVNNVSTSTTDGSKLSSWSGSSVRDNSTAWVVADVNGKKYATLSYGFDSGVTQPCMLLADATYTLATPEETLRVIRNGHNITVTGPEGYLVIETIVDDVSTFEAKPALTKGEDYKFHIKNVTDLKIFRAMVNVSGMTFAGETVVLDTSIDLDNENWEPIGTSAHPVAGIYFDGQGKTISNLKIAGTDLTKQGLFGVISLTQDEINHGPIPYFVNLTIENVDIDIAVTAENKSEGVGPLFGSLVQNGTVSNVTVTGSVKVKGSKYVGGLAGYGLTQFYDCKVIDTTDDGGIIAGSKGVGGIEGFGADRSVRGGGVFDSEVANFKIYGDVRVGGLMGQANGGNFRFERNTVSNVTFGENTELSYSAYNPAIFGTLLGCDHAVAIPSSVLDCTVGENVVAPEGVTKVGKDANGAPLADNLKTIIGTNAEIEYLTEPVTFKISGGTFEQLPTGWLAEGCLMDKDPVTGLITVVGALKPDDQGVYHIATMQDLKVFRLMVNGGNTFGGKTVVLDNDITFEGEWNSGIGSYKPSKPFMGVFDGCGNKITGLKIVASTEDEGVGLFGYLIESNAEVYDATVKNLTLENATISGKKYVGSICGYSFRAVIENCKVVGSSIVGGTQVGGILGRSQALGRVSGCEISASSVTGMTDRAGGIVGVMQGGNIVGNSVIGTEASKLVVSAAAVNAGCGAGAIVSQIYNNDGGDNTITDNNIIHVETKTAETVDFVPVGNLASGWYQSDYNHIVLRNHWEPKTEPDYYDMQDFANPGTYTRVNNFHPVAQIEGKGLAARYESLHEAYAETVDGDTIKILSDFALTEAFSINTAGRNNLVIDLNGKTMTLNSVVSTWQNLTFANGSIDVGIPAGGRAGEHAWEKLFYVEHNNYTSRELKFDNVTLAFTNDVSDVGFAASYTTQTTFKDCTLVFAGCKKPITPTTGSKFVFDHTVITAENVETGLYIMHGENANCGPIVYKNGTSVTLKACGGLNSNSDVEVSDSTINASGLKTPLFNGGSLTLSAGAKIIAEGVDNHVITSCKVIAGEGSEVFIKDAGYLGINCFAGSVFKSGSKITVLGSCRLQDIDGYKDKHTDVRVDSSQDLTIEKGAIVDIADNVRLMAGATIHVADGKYGAVIPNTEEVVCTGDLTGGIYKVEPADAFVNEAYEKVANEAPDTKDAYPTRVQAKPSVASYETAEGGVVNTYSLEKAVELVKAGGKVTLLAPNAESFTTTRTEPFTLVTSEGKAFTGKITMPNGYALKDNEDGTYSYYKMPIATITREGVTIEYDSLPAACAAAQNGDTIALSPMIIDATDTYVIKDLTFKKVTLKGAGRDKTVLDWGNGYKLGTDGAGTDSNNHLSADLTFENLALTITHADGMPYDEWMKHPNSVTFRNATINGQYVAIDPTLFDNCNFTGPVNGYDEYLIWVYGSETVVSNCTFEKSGSHACIKLYNDSGYMCSAKVLGTTSFAKIGDEGGVITVSHSLIKAADSDFAYDLQIDTDAVTIPDGAKFVGHDPGEWGAQGITVVNGTMKDGKYVSGAVFSDRGTDKQICDIAAKVVGPDSVCLAYVGPATVLGNFRWYIGDKQITPKADGAPVEGVPQDAPTEVKQQVAADTNNVIKTLSGDDITKFADTDVAGSSFDSHGNPKPDVVVALQNAANNEAVAAAIAAQLGESNSNERIEIKLDKFEFTVQNQSATLSVVEYDVKPWIKVTTIVDNVEKVTEEVIPNSALAGHPLTFRLAVNSNFVNYAKVTHKDGDTVLETYLTEVFAGATGKYVQLKSDHFSNFFISANVTEPKCKVGDQFYNSVPEAIAANVGVPDAVFTLMAPCGDEGLALLEGQTIDLNGQAFTGSIAPVDVDHEQVTYDGKVFNAYKPQMLEFSTGDKLPVRVVPTVFATWKDGDTFVKDANGMEKWKNDVLGVKGSVAANKIVPMMVKAAEGSSVVTIKTPIAKFAPLAKSGVKVQYSLLKRNGGGEFVRYGESKDTPVFTVDVSAIETQTFWKIQVSYEKEY